MEADAYESMQAEGSQDDGQSFFIPESGTAFGASPQPTSGFGSAMNPEASAFTMTKSFGDNSNSPISKVFGDKAPPSFSTKFGETNPTFSTPFGGSTTPKPMFGQTESSGNLGIASTGTSTSFLPQADTQTANQDNSIASGPSAPFSFSQHTPFSVSTSPSISSPQPPSTFTNFNGFNFSQPTQPPPSTSPLPPTTFQFTKPVEPASANPSSIQRPDTTSFKFAGQTSTPFSQPTQAPLPSFATPSPPKGKSQIAAVTTSTNLNQRRTLSALYLLHNPRIGLQQQLHSLQCSHRPSSLEQQSRRHRPSNQLLSLPY